MAMDLAMTVDISISGVHEFTDALAWMQTMVIMERLRLSYIPADTMTEAERMVVDVFRELECIHDSASPTRGAYHHLRLPTLTAWDRMTVGASPFHCHEGSPTYRAMVAFERLGLIAMWMSGEVYWAHLRMPKVTPPKEKIS